jgi:hypothetical protein
MLVFSKMDDNKYMYITMIHVCMICIFLKRGLLDLSSEYNVDCVCNLLGVAREGVIHVDRAEERIHALSTDNIK